MILLSSVVQFKNCVITNRIPFQSKDKVKALSHHVTFDVFGLLDDTDVGSIRANACEVQVLWPSALLCKHLLIEADLGLQLFC